MPSNLSALERAFERGDAARANLGNRADMLTGEQIAARLGLSPETVDHRRTAGTLLAIDSGIAPGFRYPEWQVELIADDPRRGTYERVLLVLADVGAWSRYRFFTQIAPALGGRTPVTALLDGEGAKVAAAAATWAAGEQGGG